MEQRSLQRPRGRASSQIYLLSRMDHYQSQLANLANLLYARPMARVGMHEAKTKLSQLVKRAEAGEEIVIQRNGKPVARLVPIENEGGGIASLRGIFRGQVWIAPDFKELPSDIPEAFGAE
jgi:prevent-host-death family protein